MDSRVRAELDRIRERPGMYFEKKSLDSLTYHIYICSLFN